MDTQIGYIDMYMYIFISCEIRICNFVFLVVLGHLFILSDRATASNEIQPQNISTSWYYTASLAQFLWSAKDLLIIMYG